MLLAAAQKGSISRNLIEYTFEIVNRAHGRPM